LNKKCRESKIGFISADCYGLAGHIFVDFGDKFVCFDKDGEEVRFSAVVSGTQPITFQWQKLVDGNWGLSVPSSSTSTLVITSFQSTQAGTYRLTASNAYGTLQSESVVLSEFSASAAFDGDAAASDAGGAQGAPATKRVGSSITMPNKTLTAKRLGMSFRSLRYRLKKLGLD
jgi:hypothetical protein